jgi:hypothetical protein
MSANKATIQEYIEGFRQGDHSLILSCLAEDVIWEMPGVYLREGRAAFDTEIENEGFIGRPEISVGRLLKTMTWSWWKARSATRGQKATPCTPDSATYSRWRTERSSDSLHTS